MCAQLQSTGIGSGGWDFCSQNGTKVIVIVAKPNINIIVNIINVIMNIINLIMNNINIIMNIR